MLLNGGLGGGGGMMVVATAVESRAYKAVWQAGEVEVGVGEQTKV